MTPACVGRCRSHDQSRYCPLGGSRGIGTPLSSPLHGCYKEREGRGGGEVRGDLSLAYHHMFLCLAQSCFKAQIKPPHGLLLQQTCASVWHSSSSLTGPATPGRLTSATSTLP
ncbi:hypothetical protein DPEC_G00065950 [Dallia pectoralis]|uniref:Uncharacterized protein n=1 Tax=Dallia pectoralis TaxID=75939 RepID=A0ACC2H8Y1_DALPE|nr:hypothetical protein DPEC_G00065950 [Dallia pectoralis]